MSVNITNNSSQILADMQPKLGLFLRAMLDDIDKTADPATPQKTGDLRNMKQKQVLGLNATITWARAYAAAQEVGHMTVNEPRKLKNVTLKPGVYEFKKYTTPGTGPHFAENAVREVLGRAEQHLKEVGL